MVPEVPERKIKTERIKTSLGEAASLGEVASLGEEDPPEVRSITRSQTTWQRKCVTVIIAMEPELGFV